MVLRAGKWQSVRNVKMIGAVDVTVLRSIADHEQSVSNLALTSGRIILDGRTVAVWEETYSGGDVSVSFGVDTPGGEFQSADVQEIARKIESSKNWQEKIEAGRHRKNVLRKPAKNLARGQSM